MDRIGRGFVSLVLLVTGGTGCASAPTARAVPFRTLRTATLDEVLTAYDGYCREIDTLSASGDLEVRDLRAGRVRRLGIRLLAGRGGRLYIKGSVAVVTALELISDGRRFWFQVPSKKTVWTGPARVPADAMAGTGAPADAMAGTGAPADAMTGTGAEGPPAEGEGVPYRALRPQDVTSSLLPEPLAPVGDEAVLLEADRQSFSLSVARATDRRGLVRRRVWLDRETLKPVRLRTYAGTGELEVEATLGGWSAGYPRRIEVSRPAQGYEAVFDLDTVERNPALPERAFAPRTPDGYSIVEVHD